MRLLHTQRLDFEEFFDTEIPPYAILSHRWGKFEVSYKEMLKKRAPEGPGLTKILKCCLLASDKRYEWVWIDTCCIDKKSSAELSEAINSMFNWYRSAQECFVHLSDVTTPDNFQSDPNRTIEENLLSDKIFNPRFSASSWFTRGWTLQELLAPQHLVFYDCKWKCIGSKESLCEKLSEITSIDPRYISKGPGRAVATNILRASVATRMSWASK
ncbi:MAG: hypothetical protein Q9222_006049 [Ikaeria aurantiellina]